MLFLLNEIIYIFIILSVYSIQATIHTFSTGEDGPYPMTDVRKLGFKPRTNGFEIITYETSYGKNKECDKSLFRLRKDEYINEFEYDLDETKINRFSFCTNKGKCLRGDKSGIYEKFENVRVLAIGIGWTYNSGSRVRPIKVMYISDYHPFQLVAGNVPFIISMTPPLEDLDEYERGDEKLTESYIKVLEIMIRTKQYDERVKEEYMIKIGAVLDFDLDLFGKSLETFKSDLERRLKCNATRRQIPEGYVGIKLVFGNLLEGPNGSYWVFPKSMTVTKVVKISEMNCRTDYYDLTGLLDVQRPEFKQYKKIQYGYVYYSCPPSKIFIVSISLTSIAIIIVIIMVIRISAVRIRSTVGWNLKKPVDA